MPLKLQCHPLTPVSAIDNISVEYVSEEGLLWLRFHADGLIKELVLPEPAINPQRKDKLWHSTCCEMFLREPDGEGYCEYNFSTSRNWAAYQFSGYREGMSELHLSKPPEIYLDFSDTHFAIEATLSLPHLSSSPILDAGFSAVIADQGGDLSYWALTHPSGKPDFHHGDCFSHKLQAAN